MDLRVRLLLALPAVLLLVIRSFKGDFLATPVVESVPFVTWYGILVPVSLLVLAWALSPPTLRFISTVGKRWFLPGLFFVVLAIGLLGIVDWTWNSVLRVPAWCTFCPESHFLPSFFNALPQGGTDP